jgi:hypothetical protein
MFEAAGAVIAAVLKVGVPIYIAALIASSLLLFLPEATAQQIGIAELRQIWRGYIGATFIVSVSLICAYGISAISRSVRNTLDDRHLHRLTLGTLRLLTADEKRLLRPFIIEGVNTVNADISDGIVGGLISKRIVYRSSNVGHLISGFPYNLQPIARKVLSEKPNLLD